MARQVDVPGAYLKSSEPMDEDIFMELPPGYNQVMETSHGREKVLKLTNFLYGLRRSGLMWNTTLHNFSRTSTFQEAVETFLYYLHQDLKLYVLVYVDDLLIVGVKMDVIDFEKKLQTRFDAKGEDLHFYLGI